MKKIIVLILILITAGYFIIQKVMRPNGTIVHIGSTNIEVEMADNLAKQTLGLSYRESLCENCGMLFTYAHPQMMRFWMKDMKFPLDIIFIREGRVTEVFENVPIPRADQAIPEVNTSEGADTVLEVNAGFIEEHNIRAGDIVNK